MPVVQVVQTVGFRCRMRQIGTHCRTRYQPTLETILLRHLVAVNFVHRVRHLVICDSRPVIDEELPSSIYFILLL